MSLFNGPSGGGGGSWFDAANPFSDDFGSFAKGNPLGGLNPFKSDFLGGMGGPNPLASFSNIGKVNPLDAINPMKQFEDIKNYATGLPGMLGKFNPLNPGATLAGLAPPNPLGSMAPILDPTGATNPLSALTPPGAPALPGMPSGTGVGGVPLFSGGESGSPMNNIVQALQGGGGQPSGNLAAQAAAAATPPPPVTPPAPVSAPVTPAPLASTPAPVPAPVQRQENRTPASMFEALFNSPQNLFSRLYAGG